MYTRVGSADSLRIIFVHGELAGMLRSGDVEKCVKLMENDV